MNYDYGNTTGWGALWAVAILMMVIGYLVILIGVYVLMALALSSFFRKVGVEPWIGWVPIYGYWKWLEVGGQAGWLSLLALVPYGSIVTAVFLAIGSYRTGIAFRKESSWVVLAIFLPFVWLFLLGRSTEVYEPALISAAGYPPPLAGYGAVPRPTATPPTTPTTPTTAA
ncbi:MAG: DUF5684 domain-containing protein [Pseudolysinimonas sp.]